MDLFDVQKWPTNKTTCRSGMTPLRLYLNQKKCNDRCLDIAQNGFYLTTSFEVRHKNCAFILVLQNNEIKVTYERKMLEECVLCSSIRRTEVVSLDIITLVYKNSIYIKIQKKIFEYPLIK